MLKKMSVLFPACILFLGLVFRLIWLDSIPFSFYHDELDYVFTGKSIATFGTDVSGTWNPWRLTSLATINRTAELPALFHSFFFTFFYDSVLWGRVVASSFGIATILLTIGLFKLLLGRWIIGLWAGSFLAINPWHIYISRSGFEGAISLFFQTVFILTFFLLYKHISQLAKNTKPRFFVLSSILVVSFFLAFFTYHAAKFTMIAFAVLAAATFFVSRAGLFKKVIVVGLLGFCVIAGISWTMNQQSQGNFGNRQTELIFSDSFLSSKVNEDRRLSLNLSVPAFFNTMFPESVINQLPIFLELISINKVTVLTQEFVKQYISVFDVYRLFVTGYEGGFQFSLIVHSYFMLSGLFFIPMGIWWLWRHDRQIFIVLIAFLIVSPVASAITVSTQSIFRSAFTYLLLVGVSGVGAWSIFLELNRYRKNPKSLYTIPKHIVSYLGNIVYFFFLCLIVVEGLRFGYTYFTQYPIRAIDNHDFEYRLLSEYLQRAQAQLEDQGESKQAHVSVSQIPWSAARAHVAYANMQTDLSEEERTAFADATINELVVSDAIFNDTCPDFADSKLQVFHAAAFEECGYSEFIATQSAQASRFYALSSPIDSRTYYWILNDPVCQDYAQEIQPFLRVDSLESYHLQRLSNQLFCRTWLKYEERNIIR